MASQRMMMLEFAGDFHLEYSTSIITKVKGLTHQIRGVDIKNLVVEFNIYESIYKSAITGSIVIADTINLIGNCLYKEQKDYHSNLQRLVHTLRHLIDCTERTGHPMHIYKLTDKQQTSEGQQTYTLHFCSREFLRNIRTKVSQTYSGTY